MNFIRIDDMSKAHPEAYEHIRQLFLAGKLYKEYKDF